MSEAEIVSRRRIHRRPCGLAAWNKCAVYAMGCFWRGTAHFGAAAEWLLRSCPDVALPVLDHRRGPHGMDILYMRWRSWCLKSHLTLLPQFGSNSVERRNNATLSGAKSLAADATGKRITLVTVPNCGHERAQRSRVQQSRKEEKLQRSAEESMRRKAQGTESKNPIPRRTRISRRTYRMRSPRRRKDSASPQPI